MFELLGDSLRQDQELEYPFCHLAAILLRLRKGDHEEDLRQAASELIAAEADAHRLCPDCPMFLVGLTLYDTYYERWMTIVAETIPADTSVEPLALIREATIDLA